MRLKSIKLSGFKSFVDPTTLPLRNNLIAIVGPNGCGKSNIIDALRWVLGESSARQLRGDALADVIFSGSSGRKPVGQASVELVFDNSDGSLTGSYGQYGEISVRRQASRDGQSVYYLNGARCRRRDVTDLFLGTGLGPRSYAIIEQGMISRLIEARPEELRNFIEEAAGISRYKERRRETEIRIRHTRENMDRVADLQDELAKRLVALKRQAETAEKFAEFKSRQRLVTGQLFTLEFSTLSGAGDEQKQITRQAEVELEARRGQQTEQEKSLELLREQQRQTTDALTKVQQKFYETGAAIARHEQALTNAREAVQRYQQQQETLLVQQTELQTHLDEDAGKREQLAQQLGELEPRLVTLTEQLAEQRQQRQIADQNRQRVAQQLDNAARDQRDAERRQQQESRLIDQGEQRLERLTASCARLRSQLESTASSADSAPMQRLAQALASVGEHQATLEQAIHNISTGKQSRVEKRQQLIGELDGYRTQLQVLRGQQAGLQALLGGAQAGGSQAADWLIKQGLENAAQLFNEIQVKSNWQEAVERFLGARLTARVVESVDVAGEAGSRSALALCLVERGGDKSAKTSTNKNLASAGIQPLGQQVESTLDLTTLFAGSYAVDDLNSALAQRKHLAAGEVLVTLAGAIVGRDWVELPGPTEGEGLLQQAAQLAELENNIAATEVASQAGAAALEIAQNKVNASDAELQQLQGQLQQVTGERLRVQGELNGLKAEQERLASERLHFAGELDHQQLQHQQEKQDLAATQTRLKQAMADLQKATQNQQPLTLELAKNSELAEAKQRLVAESTIAHRELEATCQRSRMQLEQLQQGDSRWQQQLENVAAQLIEVSRSLDQGIDPINHHEQALQQALKERDEINEKLSQARRALELVEQRLGEADQGLQAIQKRVADQGEALQNHRLKTQELQVRATTLNEQATREGFDLISLLPDLDDSWQTDTLQTELEKLERRINQLGAINLAAIEEHQQVTERKDYLDAQQADLQEALETMSAAIGRIDRETRGRFRETFDQVNEGLQRLFPQLFGGGLAQLELVGDDLLSAGVAITAQPPGKRNSSIHLLSGGEKALTAIALVFAIFQLNPAPFCVLDEVDAPLDDANVDRFCEMVRQMSDQVQFVFITHNKTTMEMAQQLSGVTMGEPGVSRLVAVDVDEAAKLVGV